MKKFLLVSSLYSPHVGGVEQYTQHLAEALAAAGHKALVLACKTDPDSLSYEETEEGIEIHRIPCYPIMNGRFPMPKHGDIFQDIWPYLTSRGIDGCIINTRFYPLSIDAAQWAASENIPAIVIDHGSAHLTVGNRLADKAIEAVEHRQTEVIKRSVSQFYCVSQASVNWLQHFVIEAGGIISNSIDAQAFVEQTSQRSFKMELGLPDDAFIVAYTGRLAPEKGTPALVEAAALLTDQNVHFLLAGNGSLRETLEATATDNVHFLGVLTPPDIAALLLEADAFCLPSRSEGFSTSLLEAAACGATIVATDVGGARELVPDKNYGIILPDAQPQSIAEAIEQLAADRKTCKSMADAAQQRVQQDYSWAAAAQATITAFE